MSKVTLRILLLIGMTSVLLWAYIYLRAISYSNDIGSNSEGVAGAANNSISYKVNKDFNSDPVHLRMSALVPKLTSRDPVGYPIRYSVKVDDASYDQSSVSSLVDVVLGYDLQSNLTRYRAIETLKLSDLDDAAVQRMLSFLRDHRRISLMSNTATYVLINDLFDLFHDQEILSDDYIETSTYIINNNQDDEVVRDYALQGLSRAVKNANVDQLNQIKGVFWRQARDGDYSLRGTAMLALNRATQAQQLSLTEINELKALARNYAVAETVDPRTKIVAVQVLSSLGDSDTSASLDVVSLVHANNMAAAERLTVRLPSNVDDNYVGPELSDVNSD